MGGVLFFVNNRDALLKSVVFDRGGNTDSGIVAVSSGNNQQPSTQPEGNWQDTLNKIVPGGGGTSNDTESMTGKLAQGIIARAPQLQSQDGAPLDEQSTQDAVNSILKDVPEGSIAIVHTLKELSISDDSSAQALKAYGYSLLKIFKLYSKNFEGIGYEITIVEKVVSTGDESELSKLPAIENLYKDMIYDLIALKVPKDVEKIHFNLVNGYEVAISSIRDMESVVSDPARGLVGISRYKAVSQIIQNNLINLDSLFTARGVVF
ncbi:MAG: hypothetical protein UW90_C0014G0003 [Candidatus Yanofskybacteria bacterium GW2011_GWB1_45_11]|uniref:Uncharacterized protein n=2 Tax=Parcubacteria group TaxID=1794811 RepID=A0A0G1BGJ2_9BACT|nr:MAG: hypothetical protein UV10_C0025G0003 [Candidatus Azambacteria bacterium GW2011_GWA1_42_19]KKT89803.1 MAG: hypothetical protein UW90_C0014G0003 [Candidatus Yanofskybacteria bacterium GW2011_GWB1_45_11]